MPGIANVLCPWYNPDYIQALIIIRLKTVGKLTINKRICNAIFDKERKNKLTNKDMIIFDTKSQISRIFDKNKI